MYIKFKNCGKFTCSVESYTLTLEKKMLLQYDNKKDKKRILIFMSQYGIDWLRESTKNHSDGTFRTCPNLFYQFYVIFGQKKHYDFALFLLYFTQ